MKTALDAIYATSPKTPKAFERAVNASEITPYLASFARETLAYGENAAVGFKWMLSQGVSGDFETWFGRIAIQHKVRLVFLRRWNVLRVYLSEESALLDDCEPQFVCSVKCARMHRPSLSLPHPSVCSHLTPPPAHPTARAHLRPCLTPVLCSPCRPRVPRASSEPPAP